MAQASDKIRHLKVRNPKQRAFLANFTLTGNVTVAAEAAGIHRDTYYHWAEHDEAFGLALAIAKQEAGDRLEEAARLRAVEGVVKEKGIFHNGRLIGTHVETEYSDTLLIFLLKGLKPEKYRERIDVAQTQIVKTIDAAAWDAV